MTSKKLKKVFILTFTALLLIASLFVVYSTSFLKTTKYTVSDSNLPSSFSGFRIAQVSDLHNASFGKDNSRLIERLKKAQPDIIVITGDLVDSTHTDIDAAENFIRCAVEIAPVYYVSGNHEAWLDEDDYNELKEKLVASDAVLLENKSIAVERGGEHITLAGIDDPDISDGYGFLSALDELTAECEGYTVLLSHRPEYFDTYINTDVSLVLSGHTHAGQLRLPFLGAIFAPGQGLLPENDKGLFRQNDTVMIVSAGLGNSIIPLRLFNNPELVIIELSKA